MSSTISTDEIFRLQILHASDLEGGIDAIERAPNFAAIEQALEAEEDNSITLSAGDNYISGPFFNASADPDLGSAFAEAYNFLYGLPTDADSVSFEELAPAQGRIDISVMNLVGFDASAFGNHEFDLGLDTISSIIGVAGGAPEAGDPPLSGIDWLGAQFPYLSSNLEFTGSGLDALYTDEIRTSGSFRTDLEDAAAGTADPVKIANSAIIEENGEPIGLIGLTTPRLAEISSPGTVGVEGSDEDLSTLAEIVNAEAARLADQGVTKIVLVSHLQQLALEQGLAPLLNGVDVIIAGGSDTILADDTDTLRPGDEAAGDYPVTVAGADGNPVAIVSTDGEYSYVGRLVVEFDRDGVLVPGSIDPNASGPVATTDDEVATLYDGADPFAEGTAAAEVAKLVGEVQDIVTAQDANVFGLSSVFLEGRRLDVRTEETNLGNLSSDANIAAAREADSTVQVSIKNGGGIRAPIGEVADDGTLLPTQANPEAGKEEGEVSELDISNALRFNNSLTTLTVTAEQLKAVLEHGVAAVAPDATPGQFAQIGGVAFSYDPDLPAGERVRTAVLLDDQGDPAQTVVAEGEVVADAPDAIRVVTLSFLADGGDGYPFPDFIEADPQFANRVDLADVLTDPGVATFAAPGTEQDALAEYLAAEFSETPFNAAETGPAEDERIQNLSVREDSLDDIADGGAGAGIELTPLGVFETGIFDESAQEIPAYDPLTQRLFVSNDGDLAVDILDVSDPAEPVRVGQADIAALDGAGGVNSVAVSGGLVAAAVQNEDGAENGFVAFYSNGGTFLGTVEAGVLPDALTFTADGTRLLVANEGEPADTTDPEGSISVIDLGGGLTDAKVTTIDFSAFDGKEDELRDRGVRIEAGKTASEDFEPEYIAVSPDGASAWATLQENNAVARIDLATLKVTDILPLGTKDFAEDDNAIDPSDEDGIAIRPVPVLGLYQPDAIASYVGADGKTYWVTANEGDTRDGEEIRVADADLDPTAFPDADTLKADEELGRLTVSAVDGDADGDGDIDQLYTFGGRSFTIWNDEGERVFDSGDQFERITAKELGTTGFNANNDASDSFDDRSDNKGPEPEGVAIGEIDGRSYAFIGLERVGGVMVYDVTDAEDSQFVQYVNTRDFAGSAEDGTAGDLGPEGLAFIAAGDSPTGEALLAVTNEVSGSTRLFGIDVPAEGDGPAISGIEFQGAALLSTGTEFQDTEIGGLSALAWNPEEEVFHALSDSRGGDTGAARFYTMKLDFSDEPFANDDLDISGVTLLTDREGRSFEEGTLDPEGLALSSRGTLFIASEGDAERQVPPFVDEFTLDGRQLRSLEVPEKYLPNESNTEGVRNNLAFESLTLSPDNRTLYAATENALTQDGPAADLEQGSSSRILAFDTQSGAAGAEYVYRTEPVAEMPSPADGFANNGLVDLIALDNAGTLLALERSFSTGEGNTIRLYEVHIGDADDVSAVDSLETLGQAPVPVEKELLLDFSELGLPLDNIEGMALGPLLPDGRQSLAVVSDNNFSPTQFTELLVFALESNVSLAGVVPSDTWTV